MAFLTNSTTIVSKLETIPGTAANMTGVEQDNRLIESSFSLDIATTELKFASGDFANDMETIIGTKKGTVSSKLAVGAGEFDDVADTHKFTITPWLENSCMKYVGVGVDDGVDTTPGYHLFYPSFSNASKTMTVDVYQKDPGETKCIKSQVIGAISSMTIAADGVGQPFLASIETQGRVDEVISVDLSAAPAFDDANVLRVVPAKYLDTVVKITDLATSAVAEFCTTKLSLGLSPEINMIECQANESGLTYGTITNLAVKLDIDPLLVTLEDWNWWTALTQEGFYKIEVISDDINIMIPRGQLSTAVVGDNGGVLRNELSWKPLRNIDLDKPSIVTNEIPDSELVAATVFVWFGEKLADY